MTFFYGLHLFDLPWIFERDFRIAVILPHAPLHRVYQHSSCKIKRSREDFKVQMRPDFLKPYSCNTNSQSIALDSFAMRGGTCYHAAFIRIKVVQIDRALFPRERVVILPVKDVAIGDLVPLDRNPLNCRQVDVATWQQLSLLDLQVDDSADFHKP